MAFKGTRSNVVPIDEAKITVFQSIFDLPPGRWLPVSFIANEFNVSYQTIRNLHQSGQVRAAKIPKTKVMLFCADDVKKAHYPNKKK